MNFTFYVGQQVKSGDGVWGEVKEVRTNELIVRVDGLDEIWDIDVVIEAR